jgi:carbon storage regulator CsrA
MLVLSRCIDQKILIGDDIVITLVDIKSRGAARIGIDAPGHLLIRRLTPSGEFEGDQANWGREKPKRA